MKREILYWCGYALLLVGLSALSGLMLWFGWNHLVCYAFPTLAKLTFPQAWGLSVAIGIFLKA